jgi:hypothetical protein
MRARASARVQQVCTPGPFMPGTGGEAGDEPVAISSRSKPTSVPSSSTTLRCAVSTAVARFCTSVSRRLA